MNKTVSIVILNYNGKALLKGLLDSVKNLDFQKRNLQVIVADNNSGDGSREFVRKNYPNVKIVENAGNIGSSGVNSAIPFVKGDYVFVLNNDLELEKECLCRLIEGIESDKIYGACAPRVINFFDRKRNESSGTWLSRSFYNGYKTGKNEKGEIPFVGLVFFRASLLKDLKYIFDPDYFLYGEDVDLGLRIGLLGRRIVYAPKAVVYHMHAATTKSIGMGKRNYLRERNLLMTFFKVCSAGNIVLLTPYVFGMRFFAMLKDLAALQLGNIPARLKAMLWIFTHIGLIAKKRKETQKLRKVQDKFLFKVFSEKEMFGLGKI